MWRRLASLGVLWAGLAGLLPAASACAAEMPVRDCCPPGHEAPCEPAKGPSYEQAACCGAAVLPAPSLRVSKEITEQLALDLPEAKLPAAAGPHSASDHLRTAAITHPPATQLVKCDGSRIYLQTARLRL